MAEDALKIRRSAKILRTKFKKLTDAWFTMEGKHDIYLMYLFEEEIATSENGSMNYKKNIMEHPQYTRSMEMKNN